MSRERVLIGHIGVDSGQMMLADPCYIKSWKDDDDFDHDATGREKTKRDDFSYAGACETTLAKPAAGILADGLGAVCSTGFGDGQYPVYVEYENHGQWGRRVMSLHIDFDDEVEEEIQACHECGGAEATTGDGLCEECSVRGET